MHNNTGLHFHTIQIFLLPDDIKVPNWFTFVWDFSRIYTTLYFTQPYSLRSDSRRRI